MSAAGTEYGVLWADSDADDEDSHVDGCFDSMLEAAEYANPIAGERGVDWIFVRRRNESSWRTFKGHTPAEALARYKESGSW